MTFYHFTTLIHLPRILRAGCLRPAESNIGSPRPDWPPTGEHVGPDVVWLTNLAMASLPLGLETGGGLDKRAVRFTLSLPAKEVQAWKPWAKRLGTHPQWFKRLAGLCDPTFTFVIERAVPATEWAEVAILIGPRQYRAITPEEQERLVTLPDVGVRAGEHGTTWAAEGVEETMAAARSVLGLA